MAKKPAKKTIPVDSLVLDGGTQSRLSVSEETVDDYTEVLESSSRWPFPPLDVFHDGNQYLVASGFHRTLAARRHGRKTVPCVVHQGTAWDAFLFGIEANKKNPLRPTQEDKRYAVERLLDSKKGLTQKQIAEIVGVNVRTVQRIVSDRRSEQSTENPTMSGSNRQSAKSDDPFDVDPFGEGGTDDAGQDDHDEELPPRPPGNGKDEPAGPSPEEEFKKQKAKTVKTAEALVRAFRDLNRLRESKHTEAAVSTCKALIVKAKNWR